LFESSLSELEVRLGLALKKIMEIFSPELFSHNRLISGSDKNETLKMNNLVIEKKQLKEKGSFPKSLAHSMVKNMIYLKQVPFK